MFEDFLLDFPGSLEALFDHEYISGADLLRRTSIWRDRDRATQLVYGCDLALAVHQKLTKKIDLNDPQPPNRCVAQQAVLGRKAVIRKCDHYSDGRCARRALSHK